MGLHDHTSDQLRLLSAIAKGSELEVLIDHPLDEDIQPEPEDFRLVVDVAGTENPLPLRIAQSVLSSVKDGQSVLRFELEGKPVLSGHLLISYKPKQCFMYSLKTDDFVGVFERRLAIQVKSQDETAENKPEDVVQSEQLSEPQTNAVAQSLETLAPLKTAGAHITEATEYHIDILFNQPLASPQSVHSNYFTVQVNGVVVAVDRAHLHQSVNRQQPTLRIETKVAIPRYADVIVSYNADKGGLTLADGSLVPHFLIQMEAEWDRDTEANNTEHEFVPVTSQADKQDRPSSLNVLALLSARKNLVLLAVFLVGVTVSALFFFSGNPEKVTPVAKQMSDAALNQTSNQVLTEKAEPRENKADAMAENNKQAVSQAGSSASAVVNSEPVKNCKLSYPKGDKYVGQCNANNRPQGQGQYNWVSGSVYSGQWQNGMREGFGTIDYSNGARYQGDWVANKKHGQGTYWSETGSRYEGEFQSGQFTLNGICYLPDGSRITGPCPIDVKQ